MAQVSPVTGANGHPGNKLVRALLAHGEAVRASVRNVRDKKPFEELGCRDDCRC